ncbi:DUF397 domain-containing protein [Kitasatospora sp. NPDC018614]|uniref:DUF397 domain-containing protein n=1 Tax=Streptomycetaceae TaxID=2062 RepID=UPI0037B09156
MTTSPEPYWFKSSYSGGSGTECVECAHGDDGTLIRDSKQGGKRAIRVQPMTWHMFIQAMRQGELW